MPTRTEVIISIGEVLECLPPGKSYRRKRYNSFDANQVIESGNEENVAPPGGTGTRCELASAVMKSRENGIQEPEEEEPQVLTVRRKTRGSEDGARKTATESADDDDEVSFNPETVNNIVENGSISNCDDANGTCKPKAKRKSSAEKFLEDNASYFQLEVLSSKTRSSKNYEHADDEEEKDDQKTEEGFHNSFLDFLKSKGVEGNDAADDDNDDEPRARSRHKSGPTSGAFRKSRQRTSSCNQSPALESDSEDSFKPPRSRSQVGRSKIKSRIRSASRDFSPSESENEANEKLAQRSKLRKKNASKPKIIDSSDDESEGSYSKSTRSRTKTEIQASPSPGKRSRRSELDKLLEAVDTSFHFETAAAAAKRIGGGELGPLEIDVSDSNMDESAEEEEEETNDRKRKHSESESELKGSRKKRKNGDLLKTYSPRAEAKTSNEDPESEIEEKNEKVWDGWETLNETLAGTTSLPVAIGDLNFSFEATPHQEPWFQTYTRQDGGDDYVFYPETRSFPFPLPYELPYSTFMPEKPDIKIEDPSKKVLKGKHSAKGTSKKKKVSECESTDSENNKRGKAKIGTKVDHLLEQPRISPRCHASTKAILHGGIPLTDEELAEALLIQDERDLHQSGYASFLSHDEASNDSMSSCSVKQLKRESQVDYVHVAMSMDRYLRNTECLTEVDLAAEFSNFKVYKDKVTVPTRSRISSEELLKNMKDKPKKKKEKINSVEGVMDQVVADHVDGLLLDCLEEELPTVPFDAAQPQTLLDTYKSCNSMNVCNSRWLRPSRPSIMGSQKNVSPRKSVFPAKAKRLVIYKEDLPGFKFDNDIEHEKLPVSKRILAKSGGKGDEEAEEKSSPSTSAKKKIKSPKKLKKEVYIARKEKPLPEAKETKEESEDDNISVTSTSSSISRIKGKKKMNKTGFPLVKKKKKKVITNESESVEEKHKSSPTSPRPSIKKEEKTVKRKQLKMDKFISRKKKKNAESPTRPSGSRDPDLSRRSTTLTKNYSELESDTESVFESKVPYRSPHMRALKTKPPTIKPKLKHK